MQKATFANGCFWCTEAIFKRLKGVKSVVSGYSGGTEENPTYEEVSAHKTNHAEAIEVEFDSKEISFLDLMYVFFRTHDPTTLNRQGADVGPQYRSAIFYHSEEQKKQAEKSLKEAQKEYKNKIVTSIEKFKSFYKADSSHQNYYERNKDARYCQVVIDPKIKKLEENFGKYLKQS